MEIALSLGSNLDPCIKNIAQAKSRIASIENVRIIENSPLYKTEPVDVAQEFSSLSFINAVTVIESDMNPTELLEHFAIIEQTLGRNRIRKHGTPRPIDIDIIYADQITLCTPALTIPHPRWNIRRFVVQPLADVRPDLVLPCETRTVAEILLSLPDEPKVIRYKEERD
ncbi:MAG: 2-amino-4-hydroxy-6-hydroxymethyldihydropteridine diphosphokinase [Kiritimatiellae bacterium]|nr:2-amino-4-hydroxy-6-hydroxymethyldihydropteridine diphosphokinase [Kiritimatiellia bacterium]